MDTDAWTSEMAVTFMVEAPMIPPLSYEQLVADNARLRSIIHRAEAQILSYNTRTAIQILDEVCAPEDHREVEG